MPIGENGLIWVKFLKKTNHTRACLENKKRRMFEIKPCLTRKKTQKSFWISSIFDAGRQDFSQIDEFLDLSDTP